jgi:YVTN family beta-propeller protein
MIGSMRRLLLLAVAVGPLHAQLPSPSSGLLNRDGIAYCQRTERTYVVDSNHGGIIILGPGSTRKTLKTGEGPVSIAINQKTGRVYVANSGDHTVSVVDGEKDKVLASVTATGIPYSIAVDDQLDEIYVASTYSNKLLMIDGRTNATKSIQAGSFDALSVLSDRHEVYLMGYESDSLSVLNEETASLTKISLGSPHLWGIIAMGKTLYVAHVQDATIAAIDADTRSVRNIDVASMPAALAVDAPHDEIYVASFADGVVSAIGGASKTVEWKIKIGGHPQALAVDIAKRLIYVADAKGRSVSVIDALKRKVLHTYQLSGSPYALVINSRTHRAFAATMGAAAYAEVPQP